MTNYARDVGSGLSHRLRGNGVSNGMRVGSSVMVRRYYSLPSLNALAAFEAAARHLSLTKAAEELNVTPGAISKQVRMLEDELGSPLFLRRHRALELTREGETMAAALREGFERISSTFLQVKIARRPVAA